jgi:Zn-dependent protease
MDFDFTPAEMRLIFQGIIFLVLSICVHEFGHAIVADKLGDRLPRSQGRTTLNPMAHADPIGTLAFPLVSLVITHGASLGFGWGKPVMVSPMSFTRKLAMRTSHMLVAAAGPAMNVLLAIVITGIHLVATKYQWISQPEAHQAFIYAGLLNFGLAIFNCIPAHPLDGGTIIEGLLPDKYLKTYQEYSIYGPFLLLAIIMIPTLRSALGKAAYSVYYHWVDLIGLTQHVPLNAP